MKLEAKAQVPGIDLTFPDGRTGWIWRASGVGDLDGTSFQKATVALKTRAKQQDAFDWLIIIDLDLVMTTAFRPLLRMMAALDQIVKERPDRRSVAIEWRIQQDDDSMRSMADQVKRQIERPPKGKTSRDGGIVINVEVGTSSRRHERIERSSK
jgi:hypothetical protein